MKHPFEIDPMLITVIVTLVYIAVMVLVFYH
jgi:hypothetical protein